MKRICLPVCLLAACSVKEPPKPAVVPRPVSIIELRESDPVQQLLLTGSVSSWAQQDVSFEVDGVVRFTAKAGTNLKGRFLTEDGEVQVEGDHLALLDKQAYEIARSSAVAMVEVAKENVDTARVQLAKVLPASLKAAEANQVRAQAEFRQIEGLHKKDAAPEVAVIRARADRDGRAAQVEEALAAMDAKKAEIKSLEARVQQAEESLRKADYDLERCTLFAPFAGEVDEVYVEAGGYVRRGQPVAHLVMMQPILVSLAVSDETASRISRGDRVRVAVRGLEEMAYARVYDKATSADPETRTFRVSILVHNERVRAPFGADDPRAKLPIITDTLPLRRLEDAGVYFVEAKRALVKDDRGYYVWADPAFHFKEGIKDGSVLHLKKYRVTPGPRQLSLQGVYLIRELTDIGNLPPGTFVAMDVPKTDTDEIDVVLAKPRWRLRPGQLAPVLLSNQAPKPGLYLPMNTIKPQEGGTGIVFLAQDGVAKLVKIRITGSVGELFRVEGEGLRPGVEVITDYIHFLQDGEPVRIIKRRGS